METLKTLPTGAFFRIQIESNSPLDCEVMVNSIYQMLSSSGALFNICEAGSRGGRKIIEAQRVEAVNNAPIDRSDKEVTLRYIARCANGFGLPIDCMIQWNQQSGHLPLASGESILQDRFVADWNRKAYANQFATQIHTRLYSPGVAFFNYPVGVDRESKPMQATAQSLANEIGPAAYDPKGNLVGITNESAEAIRAVLRQAL